MTKTVSILIIVSLACAATLAADAQIPDLAAIKPGPVVTSLPAAPAVPNDVRTDFQARAAAASKLIANGSFDEARAAYDAIAKDFAAYPHLVRNADMGRIYGLMRARAWDKREWPILDAIATSGELVTRDAIHYLMYRLDLADLLRRPADVNDSILRLLAQPGLTTNELCRLKGRFVRNLGGPLGRPADAVAVAEKLLVDPAMPAFNRRETAAYAAVLAAEKLGDPVRGEALYNTLIAQRPSKGDYIAAHALLSDFLEKHAPSNALSRAEAIDRKIADDPEMPMDQRARHVERIIFRRRTRFPGPMRPGMLAYAAAFIETNAAALPPKAPGLIRAQMLQIANSTDPTIATETAKLLIDDPEANGWARSEAALRLSNDALSAGDLAAAEKVVRHALAKKGFDTAQTAKLIEQLGRLRIAQNDLDGAIACYEEGYAYDSSPAMTNAVVPMIGRAYGAFFREKEGIAYCEQRGQLLAAAALCQTKTYADEAEANRLLAKVLDDEKQPVDSRRAAYEKLFARDFARGDRYYDLYASGNYRNTNGAVRAFCNSITANGEGFGFYGKYDALLHVYEKYLRPLLDADHRATDYAVAQYVLYAYCSFGRFADAAATARHIVETSPKLAPAERYHLLLAAELLPCEGDAAKLKAAIAKADAALADDVPPADRVAKIQSVGCAAMIGNREDLVRALEEYRKALYVPQPKKRYTVRFSERQVLGADSWDSLPFKPEEQPMDRVYGGSMDFLKTDVATGDRGEGVGGASDGKAISFPTLSAVADVQGIHFRFVAPNPRAREVENRMLEGGSYEGYIAPGANQPYICFLGRMSTGAFTLYNTAYDSPNHRRIPTEDHSLYRSQISYSDDAITTYFMLSWDAYATLIPEKGTVWDFENINWRKPGSACWNGTESIHGRSTWGELVFDISDKDRIAILRRILFKVVADYKAEKRTTHAGEGVLEHWSDPSVGDPAFYNEYLAPLVEKLDGYAARVVPGMTDADVIDVAENALKEMRELRFVVERLRARYLREKLQ